MDLLPLFLRVRDHRCVIVGGGNVAARKASLLARAGAQVTFVAPRLGAAAAAQVKAGEAVHVAERFRAEHVTGARLVLAATDDPAVNREVTRAARASGIPVNIADQPGGGDFILPSVVDRSPMLVALTSGGGSPVLARLLRARLETMLPAALGALARLLEDFRARAAARIPDATARRRFWEEILDGPVAELVLAGREPEARARLQAALDEHTGAHARGEVYLVGAGPGDPDLLTFRAVRLMQRADVVLHDRLVSDAVLDLARRDAERIFVGKQRARHALPQAEINGMMVERARAGRRVLRLKGGDPFLFGRGGEEIAALADAGIPFQVVPGITAATGCAAYAGIPLTHRDHAHACVFATGHLRDGKLELDWESLCAPRQTLAIYMGLAALPALCRGLVEHGLSAGTPAALVQQGTTPRQRVLTGTLATLPGIVEQARVEPPTLLIVGDVVRLHRKLHWYHPEEEPVGQPVAGTLF